MNWQQAQLAVRIGMPVAELLKQDYAQELGLDVSESEPDFWGTDDPIALLVELPAGSIIIRQVDYRGIFIQTSPNSINGEQEQVSRVRSISVPILSNSISATSGFEELREFCEALPDKLGDEFKYDALRSVDLRNEKYWTNLDEFNACRFHSKDKFVTIGLQRDSGSQYFRARLFAGEDLDSATK